jgi:hypothetical protein
VVRLKGNGKGDIIESVAMVIIVFLSLLALAMGAVPEEFTGTEAGAFAVATGTAYSVSGLSLVDDGSVTRFLNGSYDIEIGIEKDSEGPLRNYYIKATPYREGEPLKPIEKVIFVGDVDLISDPLRMENVTYIRFEKSPGKAVKIAKVSKTYFSEIFCREPAPEQIKEYIQRYSQDKEEEKWVKTIIMEESRYEHCQGSPAGAFGLMQLMATAARHVGISEDERYDPEHNVEGGIRYYRGLVERYKEHEDKHVLAAANYNCGRIGTLVSENCESETKKVYDGCWEKEIRGFTERDYCQGTYGMETYNYIRKIQRCVKYYERNTDCYNAPDGKTTGCPISSECD